MKPVPRRTASSSIFLCSPLYWHWVSTSSISLCIFSDACFIRLVMSCATWSIDWPVGWPVAGSIISFWLPTMLDTDSGTGVGLIPQLRSSTGSKISHMRATAWSTLGRTMLITTLERPAPALAPRALGPFFSVSTKAESSLPTSSPKYRACASFQRDSTPD